MKKKLMIYCLALAAFGSSNTRAQMAGWTITQGGGGTIPANMCESLYGGGSSSMSLRLKDNLGTDRTSSAWFYEDNLGFSPDLGCIAAPTLRTPACTSTITPHNYGTTSIKAYYGGPAGGGGTLAAIVTVNIWPSSNWTIAGSITPVPSTGIGSSQTFSKVVTSTAPMLSSTNATWWISTGYLSSTYYSLSTTSGSSTIVTPQPLASLTGTGYRLNASFSNPYACSGFSGQTGDLARTPQIKVISGAPGGILCSTATLQGNVGINPATGGPGGTLSAPEHQKDCLLQWNWYKVGSATPIGPANAATLTVTTPGTYYMAVTQYNNVNLGSFWGYDMLHPIVTKNSNSITLVAPATGTLIPNFTINGFSLSGTTSVTPRVFSSCPTPSFIFNGASSSGPINNYTITITRIYPTSSVTGTLSGLGAPPSSLNISSYVTTPGTYSLALGLSNGCSTPTTYTGYIKISTTPTNNTNINYLKYVSGVGTAGTYTYNNSFGIGSSWANPADVGRWTTQFVQDITSSFINGSPGCSYQAWAYAGDLAANPSLPAVCSTTVTSVNCTTAISSISIPITQFWGTPFVPYFGNTVTVPNLSKYSIKVRLTNPCGYTDVIKYIRIHDVDAFGNGYYKPGESIADVPGDDKIQFSPMPFKQELTAALDLEEAANTSLTIMTVDGRAIDISWKDEQAAKGHTQKIINTANWAPGIYFYKLMINGVPHTGKLIKQ